MRTGEPQGGDVAAESPTAAAMSARAGVMSEGEETAVQSTVDWRSRGVERLENAES